jgi:hypothetical protein
MPGEKLHNISEGVTLIPSVCERESRSGEATARNIQRYSRFSRRQVILFFIAFCVSVWAIIIAVMFFFS